MECGQFYGPSADDLNDALRAANPGVNDPDLNLATDASTLPTGVAGEFDVSSDTGHTKSCRCIRGKEAITN